MPPFPKSFIPKLLSGVLGLTALLSVGSLFGWSYPLELFSHFRVYYLLLSAGIGTALLLTGPRRVFWLALALLAFNSVWVVPWYLPQVAQATGEPIRVLTFNINVANTEWNAIADAIQTARPDVAVVIETSPEATAELTQRLTPSLPFTYRTIGGGLTIFSQVALSPRSQILNSGTILVASLRVRQTDVTLVAAHPLPPIGPSLFQRRNASLAEITAYLEQQQFEPLILLGDFNVTPWSPYYARLIQKTGLHNTRLGFGIEPSWIEAATHVDYPAWITALVKLPIDHIFVSPAIRVVNCKTVKAANSDHRLLWSDLVL